MKEPWVVKTNCADLLEWNRLIRYSTRRVCRLVSTSSRNITLLLRTTSMTVSMILNKIFVPSDSSVLKSNGNDGLRRWNVVSSPSLYVNSTISLSAAFNTRRTESLLSTRKRSMAKVVDYPSCMDNATILPKLFEEDIETGHQGRFFM